jgi:hypothetical protein
MDPRPSIWRPGAHNRSKGGSAQEAEHVSYDGSLFNYRLCFVTVHYARVALGIEYYVLSKLMKTMHKSVSVPSAPTPGGKCRNHATT